VCGPVVFIHPQCGLESGNLDGANLGNCWWCHRARRFGQREVSIPCRRAAKGGNCPSESSTNIFLVNQAFYMKPKKCVSANQRNCMKTCSTSTFSRTSSKQYGLPIAHN